MLNTQLHTGEGLQIIMEYKKENNAILFLQWFFVLRVENMSEIKQARLQLQILKSSCHQKLALDYPLNGVH